MFTTTTTTLLRLLALLSPVFSHPTTQPLTSRASTLHPFACGTEPTAEFLSLAHSMSITEASTSSASSDSLSAAAIITIQTYVHVVATSSTSAGGYITQTQVNNQISYMNNAYSASGFQFALAGTDFTINTSWANDGAEVAMKTALRKGTYRDLNLYFLLNVGGAGSGLLGYCYFPVSTTTGSTNFIKDGCSVASQSVPGGTITNYNLGGSAAHETGHWLGLLHTFQGGCTGTGDSVADTPAQASATSGCPASRDSCPTVAGLDPIHNYMDYSYDVCYTQFTAGQATRMSSMWTQFRAGK